MVQRKGKGDLLWAALNLENADGPAPYGEMHVSPGFVQSYLGRSHDFYCYRDELEMAVRVGRGLVKPFWYGSIFRAADGGLVDSARKIESMVINSGDPSGVTADEAREMREAIGVCRDAGVLCAAQLGGILCYAWRTCGFENLFLGFYVEQELARRVIQATVDRQRHCAEQLADCGFEVVCFSDDVSGNDGLFMSPAQFREWIIPGYRRILEPLVQAGIRVVFHSDGIITPVLDDIIDAGVCGYQSVEYGLNDLGEVLERFGRRISLWGNVNCDVIHAGPVEEIPSLVAECLAVGSGHRGYVLSSDNSIFDEVPVDHFRVFHRAMWEQGVAVEPPQ